MAHSETPRLSGGWRAPIQGRSASSPAISPDGRIVKVSDGNGTAGLINPRAVGAKSLLVNIEACNLNRDDNPDPGVCSQIAVPLVTDSSMGTMPMLDDMLHYQYEIQISDLLNTEDADLRPSWG